MRFLLAVDLGKSHCRAALLRLDGGEPVAARSAPGAPGLADPRGVELALAAIRAALPTGDADRFVTSTPGDVTSDPAPAAGHVDEVAVDAEPSDAMGDAARPPRDADEIALDAARRLATGDAEWPPSDADGVAAIVVGAAGALAAPEAAWVLADALAREFGVDAVVTSDAVLAHAGALGGEPGVVLVAGTGAVAVALAADGRLAVADGAGPWLGDEGSGAWIGFAALRAALRAEDGRGGPTALQAAARERFPDLPRLGAEPVPTAASFAPDVARAAAGGDETAAAILADAARALASTAAGAAKRAGMEAAPVTLTGGLADLGESLLEPLRAALDLRPAVGPPLEGARVLARGEAPHRRHAVVARSRESRAASGARPRVERARTHGGEEPRPERAAAGGAESRDERAAAGGGEESCTTPTEALDRLPTEAARPDLDDLDARPVGDVVALLVDAEARAHDAVRRALPELVAATEAIAARLSAGGRLRYVGAGTSGRIALQDAAECSPTFGIEPDRVVAVAAGGPNAARVAVEAAEDDVEAGARDLEAVGLVPRDAVVGISASGRTPYVLGALRAARAAGALTIAVANSPGSPIAAAADIAVEVETGAEVLAGSTRLTAGTTQKIVLNAISTAAMIHLGKAYGPRMVDLLATNEKLRHRALRIVAEGATVDEGTAQRALDDADWHVKTAIVALVAGVSADEARDRLTRAGGHARAAIQDAAQ